MISHDGRYVIVFNGEIYNFQELRAELQQQGHTFRGHSDTEVMLAAFCQWGIEPSVKRFAGMFAFALWDRQTSSLYLARDRLGKKPLYYAIMGGALAFASELKALRAWPDLDSTVDRGALALFMRHGYIPQPHSIYKSVKKLPPGTFLRIQQGNMGIREPTPYWTAQEIIDRRSIRTDLSDVAAAKELTRILSTAVQQRMIADVPLGAFLSGGIDSSTVVALMQDQSEQPIRTFTIGFEEAEYDEAKQARAVAEHLGTDHTEMYVSPEDAMAVIERLPQLYDEPFADASQIPTFLVSEFARRNVTVAMSGDGGDEMFAGYNRHFLGASLWRKTHWWPQPIRSSLAGMIRKRSPDDWENTAKRFEPWLPRPFKQRSIGEKLYKAAGVLESRTKADFYKSLVSHWTKPEALVIGAAEPPTLLTDHAAWAEALPLEESMMYLDTVTYLPDDILAKVDRASMGVSLEVRAPLLDHRVMEYAWSLPLAMKVRNGQGKWILRQVLDQYVPRDLIERPKTGFGLPIDSWLRGPLRGWADGLLDESRLREEGFLTPQIVQQKWQEHLSGKKNWHHSLWAVLMFQLWQERWVSEAGRE